jgi:hypothetical protein
MMYSFVGLFCGVGYLAVMALDVLCFFTLVRLLAGRVSYSWLLVFDRVGQRLVRGYTIRLERGMEHLGVGGISEQKLLALGLFIASALRLVLAALLGQLGRV